MTDAGFQQWKESFRKLAMRSGVSASTFELALGDVQPDASVVAKDRAQTEVVLPIWEYLDRVVSDQRVTDGSVALGTHANMLAEIEFKFGIPAEIIVAIWGAETNFGATRGDMPVFRALVALSTDARRGALFERQLLAALQIVQCGEMQPADMVGSWAGAMGHTQFMPTSLRDFAVDWSEDGRRGICDDDPTDALASTANFLRSHGWQRGLPWITEVELANDFDFTLSDAAVSKPANDWLACGVSFCSSGTPKSTALATLALPTGKDGPAFLMYENATVLRNYNNSDAYVLAVGLLAQRIKGGSGLKAKWPTHSRPLERGEMRKLQTLLTANGCDTFGADGLVGPNTTRAVRAYQRANSLPPDGYPSRELFEQLQAK